MARKIKVKLILQLKDAGISQNSIAKTYRISRHSVSEVFAIADEKNIHFCDVKDREDPDVYRLFYPGKYANETMFADPNYAMVHDELKKVGVTLKLLHEEYVERCKKNGELPMGKTKFNEGYAEYTIANRLTNHINHKIGDRVEVDWSGSVMHYVDTFTCKKITVYLFVATLPFSQYSYVEPCLDMKMDTFLRCHIHLFEFIGGVPRRIVCDNLKTGVVAHPKEGDIILTDAYSALGEHYLTAIMPAPVKTPKAKASVEGTVGDVATAIIARCRNEAFNSFESLKQSVAVKLDEFNRSPFQKREASRYEVWQEERQHLRPVPDVPYVIAEWVYGRSVNLDFHVVYLRNRYSCPYQYVHKKVDLKVTDTTIEIYYQGERVTSHTKFPDYVKNRYSTHPEDMPPAFKDIVEWDDGRICRWASSIGKYTRQAVDRIFASVSIKEQGYNPCLAVLRLSRTYTDERLELACELAFSRGIKVPRYHHLKTLLATNQDLVYKEQQTAVKPAEDASMGYLRGSDYYRKGGVK